MDKPPLFVRQTLSPAEARRQRRMLARLGVAVVREERQGDAVAVVYEIPAGVRLSGSKRKAVAKGGAA